MKIVSPDLIVPLTCWLEASAVFSVLPCLAAPLSCRVGGVPQALAFSSLVAVAVLAGQPDGRACRRVAATVIFPVQGQRCASGAAPPAARETAGGRLNAQGKRVRLQTRVYYCRACKVSWHADPADAQAEQIMSADGSPEYDLLWIAGSDHSADLERTRQELRDLDARGLDDQEEDAERERLRAERARLAALPVIPPKRELSPTGRPRGQAWDTMTHAERVACMRSGEFVLELSGRGADVQVERKFLPQVVHLARGVPVGDGVRAVKVLGMPVIWGEPEEEN